MLNPFVENFEEIASMLLTEYGEFRNDEVMNQGSRSRLTMLQLYLRHWVLEEGILLGWPEEKLPLILHWTDDLWCTDGSGTPLDTLARLDPEFIPAWLQLGWISSGKVAMNS